MTWQKLGSEFWDDCADTGLTDAAVRTHGEAIGFIYRIEQTELRIKKTLVRRFAGSPHWEQAITELLTAGYWLDDGDCYAIVHHADVITASIAAQRVKRERDKQAQRSFRKRAKPRDVSVDVSADVAATQTDSQTTSLGREGSSATRQSPHSSGRGEESPSGTVSADVSADTSGSVLRCEACGGSGPTVVEDGWRRCEGLCEVLDAS